MPNQPGYKRAIQLDMKSELDKLLEEDELNLKQMELNKKDFQPIRLSDALDYIKVKGDTVDAANKLVDSVALFYLSEKIINEISYIKQKTESDKLTLSTLFFQLKTSEHAITKILEDIDSGGLAPNMQPRMFEVLGTLQRSNMEIVKHLTQFMIILENNYKNIKIDYQVNESNNQIEIGTDDDSGANAMQGNGMQTRGTKGLIESLRAVIPEKRATSKNFGKIEAVDFTEESDEF